MRGKNLADLEDTIELLRCANMNKAYGQETDTSYAVTLLVKEAERIRSNIDLMIND